MACFVAARPDPGNATSLRAGRRLGLHGSAEVYSRDERALHQCAPRRVGGKLAGAGGVTLLTQLHNDD